MLITICIGCREITTVSDVRRMPTWMVVVGGMFEPQIGISRWSMQARLQSHLVKRWMIPREN